MNFKPGFKYLYVSLAIAAVCGCVSPPYVAPTSGATAEYVLETATNYGRCAIKITDKTDTANPLIVPLKKQDKYGTGCARRAA